MPIDRPTAVDALHLDAVFTLDVDSFAVRVRGAFRRSPSAIVGTP
jgi:hypothetical protein